MSQGLFNGLVVLLIMGTGFYLGYKVGWDIGRSVGFKDGWDFAKNKKRR